MRHVCVRSIQGQTKTTQSCGTTRLLITRIPNKRKSITHTTEIAIEDCKTEIHSSVASVRGFHSMSQDENCGF